MRIDRTKLRVAGKALALDALGAAANGEPLPTPYCWNLNAVNFRAMFDVHGPAEGSIAPQVYTLAKLQQQGILRHVGISNVTLKTGGRGTWCC